MALEAKNIYVIIFVENKKRWKNGLQTKLC